MLLYRAGRDTVSGPTLCIAIVIVGLLNVETGFAGPESTLPARETQPDARESSRLEVPTARESRGLVTFEGPSGMFLNPTSATLPQGRIILNYCVFIPDLPEGVDVNGHWLLLSYGLRDWLEIGLVANLIAVSLDGPPSREDTFIIGGPMARIRLLRDRDWWPELSIGAYAKLGTPSNISNGVNAFVAVSKTIPIAEKGLLKSITFQGGFREQWLVEGGPVSNINRFYGGMEVQLPHNFYAIGEITQRDHRVDRHVPWAAGIQWRGKWFGCTLAALQNGGGDGPGFYFGVGGGLGAEPVRSSPPTTRP